MKKKKKTKKTIRKNEKRRQTKRKKTREKRRMNKVRKEKKEKWYTNLFREERLCSISRGSGACANFLTVCISCVRGGC